MPEITDFSLKIMTFPKARGYNLHILRILLAKI